MMDYGIVVFLNKFKHTVFFNALSIHCICLSGEYVSKFAKPCQRQ
jgi:hypothetical protein